MDRNIDIDDHGRLSLTDLGKEASEPKNKELKDLPEKSNTIESMTEAEHASVRLAELLATETIEKQNARGMCQEINTLKKFVNNIENFLYKICIYRKLSISLSHQLSKWKFRSPEPKKM